MPILSSFLAAFFLVLSSFVSSYASSPPAGAAAEEMEVDGQLTLHQVSHWAHTQPQERWTRFMHLFKQQDWTKTQWTTYDWEEVMCYTTLQQVLNDGCLRNALAQSPDPQMNGLQAFLP